MDYLKFVNENLHLRIKGKITEDEKQHIADCLEMIWRQLVSNEPSDDDFINAVCKRDFYRAMQTADSTNIITIHVYASWMYNHAPAWHEGYVK